MSFLPFTARITRRGPHIITTKKRPAHAAAAIPVSCDIPAGCVVRGTLRFHYPILTISFTFFNTRAVTRAAAFIFFVYYLCIISECFGRCVSFKELPVKIYSEQCRYNFRHRKNEPERMQAELREQISERYEKEYGPHYRKR